MREIRGANYLGIILEFNLVKAAFKRTQEYGIQEREMHSGNWLQLAG